MTSKIELDLSPGQHSLLGASGSSRWLACPGSIALAKQHPVESKTSRDAARGTLAHAIGEHCLKNPDIEPWEFAGARYEVEGYTFQVDCEMVDGIGIYLDYCERRVWEVRFVEDTVNLVKEHEELWGSVDFGGRDESLLEIVDLKFGYGVVEPKWNTQLMQYAAMVIATHKLTKLKRIRLTVVQPRADHPDGPIRSWEISPRALNKWVRETLGPGARATEAENPKFEEGDHCIFCPAKAHCPLKAADRQAGYAEILDAEEDLPATVGVMTNDQLAHLLDRQKAFMALVADAKVEAERRAMGGQMIPGYKLVKATKHRVWRTDDDVEQLAENRFGPEAFTTKFKTPAQLEKISGDGKNFVAEHSYKPDGGLLLVEEGDKRTAVDPQAPTLGEVLADIE